MKYSLTSLSFVFILASLSACGGGSSSGSSSSSGGQSSLTPEERAENEAKLNRATNLCSLAEPSVTNQPPGFVMDIKYGCWTQAPLHVPIMENNHYFQDGMVMKIGKSGEMGSHSLFIALPEFSKPMYELMKEEAKRNQKKDPSIMIPGFVSFHDATKFNDGKLEVNLDPKCEDYFKLDITGTDNNGRYIKSFSVSPVKNPTEKKDCSVNFDFFYNWETKNDSATPRKKIATLKLFIRAINSQKILSWMDK